MKIFCLFPLRGKTWIRLRELSRPCSHYEDTRFISKINHNWPNFCRQENGFQPMTQSILPACNATGFLENTKNTRNELPGKKSKFVRIINDRWQIEAIPAKKDCRLSRSLSRTLKKTSLIGQMSALPFTVHINLPRIEGVSHFNSVITAE